MSQDRVAALHLLITAQVGGAITDTGKLASAVKTLGPTFANAFKQGTDELRVYDREVERLFKKIGRGQGTPADIQKLQGIQAFYEGQNRPAPTMTPDPTFSRFGGLSPEQLALQNQHLARQEQIAIRNANAQGAIDFFHRTQPPVMYGPNGPDDDSRAYQNWLQTRAGGKSQAEIQTDLQYQKDAEAHRLEVIRRADRNDRMYGRGSQDFSQLQESLREEEEGAEAQRRWQQDVNRRADAMNRSYGRGPSTDFSASTGPRTYGEFKAGLDPKMLNTAYVNDFERSLSKLDDRQLEKVRKKFGEINTEARDVSKQMASIDKELSRRGRLPEYGPGAPGSAGHEGWLEHQNDPKNPMSGAARRRFMYATQNIGYGIEDAVVSYQLGGVKAAARAAGNNVSALASLIPNPGIQLASIIGVAALTASAGPIADAFDKAFNTAKVSAESFGKTLDTIRDKIERIQNVKFSVRDANTAEKLETISQKAKDDIETYEAVLASNQKQREEAEADITAWEEEERKMKENPGSGGDFAVEGGQPLDVGYIPDWKKQERARQAKEKIKALDAADAALVMEKDYLKAQEADRQSKAAKPFVEKADQMVEGFARNTRRMNEFIDDKLKDGGSLAVQQERIKAQAAEEKKQITRALASGEIRQEDADRMSKAIDKRTQKQLEDAQDKNTEYTQRRTKTEKEQSERMRDSLTEITDKRKAILLEQKKNQEEIDAMTTVSDATKAELTGLNNEATKKKLADYDQPKNFKPITDAIEIGSRADAELKQSLMGRDSSAEKLREIAEKELETLKSIEEHLKSSKLKTAAFKSGKA